MFLKKKKDPGALLVLAGLFIGIGVGVVIYKTAAGTFIGLHQYLPGVNIYKII